MFVILAEIFAWAAAAARFLVSTWWIGVLGLVVILGVGLAKTQSWFEVMRYEADVQAGRRTPFKMDRCQECSSHLMPCEVCVQAWKETNPV